jgi:lipopolysaccharide transport system ATP-binding protein
MTTPVIRVNNLGKRYRLTLGRPLSYYKTLRESLVDLVKAPFRPRVTAEEFWALKDVSFDVHAGQVVGIIGRNGAGKSTLLKILSQITKPTAGHVEIDGRVGSLLEVGTGFHPELTGRENVFLNGSILGMTRREIAQKFDEIVAFAEVEKFLDTPVKRYSSGMYVRLAFAVAAHLEPEILIVDEVLAVGDATFQQKCLEKMRQCASNGRTVLLVSHQMNSVRDLCDRAVWLSSGAMRMVGPVTEVINQYLAEAGSKVSPGEWIDLSAAPRTGDGMVRFQAAVCYGARPDEPPLPDGPMHLTVRVRAAAEVSSDMRIDVQILDRYQTPLVRMNSFEGQRPLRLLPGDTEVTFAIERLHLAPGVYSVNLLIADASDDQDLITDALRVEVVSETDEPGGNWADGSVVTRSFHYKVRAVGTSSDAATGSTGGRHPMPSIGRTGQPTSGNSALI